MIRIICKEDDYSCPGNTGSGPSITSYKTFEIDCPALEAYLKTNTDPRSRFVSHSVIGAEVVEDEPCQTTSG